MALRFPCPTCNRELSAPESIVGSEVQCPACQTVFLAGEQRGSGATGIASERQPLAGAPIPAIKNPYRNETPDEDHPLRRPDPLEGGRSSRLGLIALLVFAPLAFIGIVGWMLMGSPAVTSAQFVKMTTTAKETPATTTRMAPPPWLTFKIPHSSKTVLLPGAPTAQPESKVETATASRYSFQDPDGRMNFEIATIRLPQVQVDDKQLAAWLRNQLSAKLQLPTDQFQDEIVLRGLTKARGREWYLEKAKDGNAGMIRAYLADDVDSSTIYVFTIVGHHLLRDDWVVREFFDSIKMDGELPREKD